MAGIKMALLAMAGATSLMTNIMTAGIPDSGELAQKYLEEKYGEEFEIIEEGDVCSARKKPLESSVVGGSIKEKISVENEAGTPLEVSGTFLVRVSGDGSCCDNRLSLLYRDEAAAQAQSAARRAYGLYTKAFVTTEDTFLGEGEACGAEDYLQSGAVVRMTIYTEADAGEKEVLANALQAEFESMGAHFEAKVFHIEKGLIGYVRSEEDTLLGEAGILACGRVGTDGQEWTR